MARIAISIFLLRSVVDGYIEMFELFIAKELYFQKVQKVSEVKITQFADDTTLFVNPMESVDNAMKKLDDFEYFAGPKINWNKTKVLKMKELYTTKYDILNLQKNQLNI